MNYDRVDQELAKYANATSVVISPEENLRLKRLIDRRVLPVMVFTYFLQSANGNFKVHDKRGTKDCWRPSSVLLQSDQDSTCSFERLAGYLYDLWMFLAAVGLLRALVASR